MLNVSFARFAQHELFRDLITGVKTHVRGSPTPLPQPPLRSDPLGIILRR